MNDSTKTETSNSSTSYENSNTESDGAFFFNKTRSDVLKKKIESMLKKDSVLKNLVSELKMPREIVTHFMSQIDDTKQAALGVISKEVRLFFENTNLSDELVKLLSQMSFEVSTRIRFVKNEPEKSSKSDDIQTTSEQQKSSKEKDSCDQEKTSND